MINEYHQKKTDKIKKLIPVPFVIGGITALVTWLRLEPNNSFLEVWSTFYLIALSIVLPIGLLAIKGINKLISTSLLNQSKHLKEAIFGMLMALTMGSLMTGASLFSQYSFSNIQSFLRQWGHVLTKALPFIVLVGLFIGLVVKPIITNYIKRLKARNVN